jgi:peptidoglycan/xylan/chitin deacetylase (PgdA/CDA1 family)
MRVRLPEGVRCAIALSYDLEMCGGYQPDNVNHGRILPEVQAYALDLCGVAESFGVRLHFFFVGNGVEHARDCLREILRRGHLVDNHTYTHLPLVTEDTARLDEELARTNRLFEEHLDGWKSTVLRGPGGYPRGLDGRTGNQEIILKNGFRWVSGRYDGSRPDDREYVLRAPETNPPYAYPTGLVEIPVQGYTDRSFFDTIRNVAPERYRAWRTAEGGKAVSRDWRAPWTAPDALEDWMGYLRRAVDHAYDRRLLWVPTWHPMTHYLHDRDNVSLRRFLEYCRSKTEEVRVCTVRDAAEMLSDS